MKKYLLFALFSSIFSSIVLSQTGKVTGQVSDASSGETLIGASILVQGTSRGTITDFEGNYTLSGLEPGTYNLVFSYISYDNQILTVEVNASGEAVLNVAMQPASIGVEEVTIVRQRRTNTEMSVISNLKAGNLIASAISAEQISKTLDSDAGEVIRRVPGVTITDGKFVIVRGLIDRYNSVLLNGATAPSFEADKRAFSFDALPSGMIDNILIYKSPAPELPADFAGAAIDIRTRSNADENSIRLGYTSEYAEGASFDKEFLTYEGGKTDWLGFDDGTRDFPSSLPSFDEMEELYKWSDLDEYRAETREITAFSKDFNEIWNPVTKQPFLNQGLSLTAQKRFVIGKMSLGNITALNYRARNRKTEIRRTEYQRYEPSIDSLLMNFNFLDRKSVREYQVGLIHNWNIIYGKNQKLTFNNFLNNLGESTASIRNGDDYYDVETIRMTNLRYNNRFIYSGQLAGIQEFNRERTHLNWLFGYSYVRNRKPDDRRLTYVLNENNDKYRLELQNQPTNVKNGGRLDINLFERIYNAGVDADHNFFTFTSEKPWTVKAGGSYQYKYRVYTTRLIGLITQWPENTPIDFYKPVEEIITDENFFFDSVNIRRAGLSYGDGTRLKDSYTAEDRIGAGYLALKIPVLNRLNIYGGVRLEKYSRFLEPGDASDPVERDTLNIFPSLNITYSINEKHQFRFAYGKTVNRPEFREISSVDYEDFDLNLIIHGNPELKDAYIRNYDLRYEWYPNLGEIISITGFYKKFRDPIEVFLIPAGTGYDYKPYNTEEAKSLGLELDVRKTLRELEDIKGIGFLKDLTVVFNASLIRSEISTRKDFARDSVRIMQGQSPYIVNLGLFYNNREHGWRVNLNYNNVGKRIAFAGTPDNPHTWELSRHLLDLSIHKEIGERFEIRLGVKDLINDPVKFVQYYGPGDSIGGVTHSWIPNRKFSVGLTVRL